MTWTRLSRISGDEGGPGEKDPKGDKGDQGTAGALGKDSAFANVRVVRGTCRANAPSCTVAARLGKNSFL